MITIGLLRKKLPSSGKPTSTAKACAIIAELEGCQFFHFTPDDVDFTKKEIRGKVFQNRKWIDGTFPFPDIVINDTAKKLAHFYDKLEREVIFTTQKQGSKLEVYEKIKKAGEYTDYFIPTEKYTAPEQVLNYLNEYSRIVLKPNSSNMGKGIISVEKNDDQFKVIENKQETFYSHDDFITFIGKAINRCYLIQPFIESRTKDGQPFDIRAHVQKNGSGEWVVTKLYPRIGTADTIVSNVAAGGSIGKIPGFLKREFGSEKGKKLKKELEQFSLNFIRHFQSLYKNSFDEIGIDLTIDANGEIQIFEVNRNPGVKGLMEMDNALNLIPYAKYLVENITPKTLSIDNSSDNLSLFIWGDIQYDISAPDSYALPAALEAVQELSDKADANIVNYEGVKGPENISARSDEDKLTALESETLTLLDEAGIHIACTANKHANFYNHQYLLNKLDNMKSHNIIPIGAGSNEMSARRGIGLDHPDEQVGILNYMSYVSHFDEELNHYSYHENTGVAVLDEKKIKQDIAFLKRKGFSSVVVCIDWGITTDSSIVQSSQLEDASLAAEAGADAVIGFGGPAQPVKMIRECPVFFNSGLLTGADKNAHATFPVKLVFNKNKLDRAEIYPIIKENHKLIPLNSKKAEQAFKELAAKSVLEGRHYEWIKNKGIVYFNSNIY